jgi:hypothetical protein
MLDNRLEGWLKSLGMVSAREKRKVLNTMPGADEKAEHRFVNLVLTWDSDCAR